MGSLRPSTSCGFSNQTYRYQTLSSDSEERRNAPVQQHVLIDLVGAVDQHPVGHLAQQGGGHPGVEGLEVELLLCRCVWEGGGGGGW